MRGKTVLDNLALACFGCNSHKATKVAGLDPQSGSTFPLFHPRQQRWSDHFTWNNKFTQVVGLTPTGRVTVLALHLNRAELVNLRQILHKVGLHPPDID